MKVSDMDQKQVRRVVDILMANGLVNSVFLTMGATPDRPAMRMAYDRGYWAVYSSKTAIPLIVTPDLGTALDWLLGVLPRDDDEEGENDDRP